MISLKLYDTFILYNSDKFIQFHYSEALFDFKLIIVYSFINYSIYEYIISKKPTKKQKGVSNALLKAIKKSNLIFWILNT